MSTPTIRDRYDVVIAGARCSGASTAMLLARRGYDVLVVDPVPRGRDTLSTHALMRGGVLQLHRWGLLDQVREAGTPAARTTTFHYDGEALSIPIKAADGVDALYAPRRTVLDPILANAAEEAGAHLVHGLAVQDLLRDDDGRVCGVRVGGGDVEPRSVSADLVISADGVRSKVARLAGGQIEVAASHSTASIYGYWPGLDASAFHWYFGPGVSMGTIPTNDGNACVFASMPGDRFERDRPLGLTAAHARVVADLDTDVAEVLAGGEPADKLRAFPGVPGFIRRSVGPGWALVGDAGFFRDPLTAHGISDALRDAELLARAVSAGTDEALAEYQSTRDRTVRGLMEVTDQISSFEWDDEQVRALHVTLSREMNVGVDLIRSWTPAPAPTR